MKTNTQKQNGFTLLEILITVLVLSIGLLGLAGLQVSSMKSNHSSYLRTQATILGYDIADRMRANPAGTYVATADYIVNTAVDPYTVDTPTTTAGCSTVPGCTTAQMANTDINQWRVDLATALPGGTGVICNDDSPNDGTDATSANNGCPATCTTMPACSLLTVKIWWDDDRDGSGFKRFTTSYQP